MDKELINTEPFLNNAQYNFIKKQVLYLYHVRHTVKDQNTVNAVILHTESKVKETLPELTEDQKKFLDNLLTLEVEREVEISLSELQQFVIPFPKISKKTVEKLFPKMKKIQMPDFEEINCQALSYVGWFDTRSSRQHMIFEYNGKLKGISGVFDNSSKPGFCSICNNLKELGLFVTRVKSGKETYVNRGNYICKDSQKCNENVTDVNKINAFLDHLLR